MDNKFDANELIESRAALRGDFSNVALAHMGITEAITENTVRELSCEETVALTMIAHKLARVVTANGYDADSWQDIAGYATLVVNKFKKN